MDLIFYLIIIGVILFLSFLRQVNQYQRGVMFTMGRYTGTKSPGWRLVVPIFQNMKKVDIRVKAVDVPNQEAITKDNVSCQINAVIYYKVSDSAKAIIEVENFYYAVSQLAQTTMRNIVGEVSLDELLSQRDQVSDRIKVVVDKLTDPWGIKVALVEVKHVDLPSEMQRAMAKQAEAERERRAKIIHAEGEYQASEKLAQAAKRIEGSPMAMQLRFLQTLTEVAAENNSTTIFPVPIDLIKLFLDNSKGGK